MYIYIYIVYIYITYCIYVYVYVYVCMYVWEALLKDVIVVGNTSIDVVVGGSREGIAWGGCA